MAAGGNKEWRSVAITGLWTKSFFVRDKVSTNLNLLSINTVKIRIDKLDDISKF